MKCGSVIFNNVCENPSIVTIDVARLAIHLMGLLLNVTIQRQMMDDRDNEFKRALNVEVDCV
jgi:hypothetical protein